MVFASKHNVKLFDDIAITVGTYSIQPDSVLRNLGAFFDSRIGIYKHINSVVSILLYVAALDKSHQAVPCKRRNKIPCEQSSSILVRLL